MSSKQNIGKIIRNYRRKKPLTLNQLSDLSGVSVAHLSRVELGQRVPSPRTLQSIARPLGFDLNELLVLAGYISPETSASSEEQRNKLRDELNMLLERMETTSKRIKEIVDRLMMQR